jgi:hypothetical protein
MIDIKFTRLPVTPPPNKTIREIISSTFGIRTRRNGQDLAAPEFHRAVDIAVVKGTPVYPVESGTVVELINNPICGIGIRLEHTQNGNKFYTQYCHFATRANIQERSFINVTAAGGGQTLGTVGDTGTAKGHPHLHFVLQISEGNTLLPADPEQLLINVQDNQDRTTQVKGYTETVINNILKNSAVQVYGTGKTDITPYIASLESFHPFIQYELTRRRAAAETANTYMPFVRLTSLVNVYKENLRGGETSLTGTNTQSDSIRDAAGFGAYFPTLGVDGQSELSFEDIYKPEDGRSIVGYATKKEGDKYIRVPLVVDKTVPKRNEDDVLTSAIDQSNIPIPGIVSVTTERSTTGPMGVRGGLFKANINIRAYSVGQLNTMLKYFLRPATRVVLELGRTSSSEYERQVTPGTTITVGTSTQTIFNKFNWQRSIEEVNEQDKLDQMVKGNLGQREFIQKYIYNNFGDYEIFIGYVVNFKIKYTKDNIYEIDLLVHSVQQFEITTKNTGVQTFPSNNPVSLADCISIELAEYFSLDTYWKKNTFASLLRETTEEKGKFSQYSNHVIPLVGDVNALPGYLITWEYFVNLVLHDSEYGLISLFQQEDPSGAAVQLLRTALIQPVVGSTTYSTTDLGANEVAWNPNLRSIDPSTLVIYNPTIETARGNENSQTIINNAITWLNITDVDEKEKLKNNAANNSVLGAIKSGTSPVGSFDNVSGKGTSLLTKGIWLNTNAIIEAFTSTDTVSMGITRLLDKMNAAVQGYWNLQPLSSEEMSGIYIIDAGMSKPVEEEDIPILKLKDDPIFAPSINEPIDKNIVKNVNIFVKDATPEKIRPKYRYMFNRKSVRGTDGDIGSELLDINVDSSLPQVIAVQAIAGVGGVGNNATLAAIDLDELKKITIYDTYVKSTSTKSEVCKDDTSGNVDVRDLNLRTIPDEDAKFIRNRITNPEETTPSDIEERTNKLIDIWAADPKNASGVDYNPLRLLIGKSATKLAGPTEEAIEAQRNKINEDIAVIRKAITDQIEARRPGYLGLLRDYATSFGMAIELIEPNVARLVQDLQINKDEYEVHPFNSSNLTKTIVDLTLPGIGGIQLWQSFGVERIPDILDRGFYVVTKVAHEFTTDKGWITKIQGRFRFKPNRTVRKITPTSTGTQPPTQQPITQQPTIQPQTPAQPAAPTQPTPQQVPQQQRPITEWTDEYLVSQLNALLSTPTDTAVGVQVPVINDRKIEIRNEIGRRLTTKNYSGQTRLYQALRWAYQRSALTQ